MTYVMLMKYMMKHLMKYDYISQPVDLDGFGLWSCTREFSGQRPAFGLQWDLLAPISKWPEAKGLWKQLHPDNALFFLCDRVGNQ